MCASTMIHQNIFHRRLYSAQSPGTDGALVLLVGLGFAAVIPFEIVSCEVARRPRDFAHVPTHHPPVSEEQGASSLPIRQVHRQHRFRF